MSHRLLVGALHDPDHMVLRRALRITVAMVPVFAVCDLVFHQPAVALFAAFASFAVVVFTDFGGPTRRRVLGSLAITVVGALEVALATAVSGSVVVSVALMVVVAFVVRFLGAYGGYYLASVPTLTLAFVLAVAIQGDAGAVVPRMIGWGIGGITAAVATAWLWPVHEWAVLRGKAAGCCRALAAAIDARAAASTSADAGGDSAERATAAALAIAAQQDAVTLRGDLLASPHRPVGPSERDYAFGLLVNELGRLAELLVEPQADEVVAPAGAGAGPLAGASAAVAPVAPGAPGAPAAVIGPDAWPAPPDERLALGAVAEVLRACAVALTGGAVPDLARLAAAAGERRAALEEWAATLLASSLDDAAVVAACERSFPTTAVVEATRIVGTDVGELRAAADLPSLARGRTVWARALTRLRRQLTPESVWFRSAVRNGVALGVAIAIARGGNLPHAFWVALGTLSVLRSNALGTGHEALWSVAGTLGGFVVACGVIEVLGPSDWLWLVLPVVVFLSAYTPTAVHFAVGQASFTVFVVVLFNIMEPQGWRTGLVRVQDVAIGVTVSVVVGAIAWPGGAAAELRRCLGEALAAAGAYVASVTAAPPRGAGAGAGAGSDGEGARQARATALDCAARANETLAEYLGERGKRRVDPHGAGALVWTAVFVRIATDELAGVRALSDAAACPEAEAALAAAGSALASGLAHLLEHPAPIAPGTAGIGAGAGIASVPCLARWRTEDPAHAAGALLALVGTQGWAQHVVATVDAVAVPAATHLAGA